jgi:hypothetical protein
MRALSYWLEDEEVNPHGMWSVLERLTNPDTVTVAGEGGGEEGKGKWKGMPRIQFPDAMPRFIDVGGMMGMMLGRKLMWTRDGPGTT